MNPLRVDPQRMGVLRRRFASEVGKRFGQLIRDVNFLIAEDDAFGLEVPGPFQLLQRGRWKFLTDDEKLKQFKIWFKQNLDQGVLQIEGDKPWTARYIEQAYRRGAIRVYIDANKAKLIDKPFFFEVSQEQFLRYAFSSPEALGRIKLVSTRAFDQLKGITDVESQNLSRILADGLVRNISPGLLARQISREIKRINNQRALKIVHTELSNAFTEGQLDTFEALGIDDISVMVEWINGSTPCIICRDMAGIILTVEQARGLIPVHPFCQCAFIPVFDKKFTKTERAASRIKLRRLKDRRQRLYA